MSQIDLDQLLADREGDDPCGMDLEYDAAFLEMQTLAKGKAEEQYGDTIIPAEEPNWREVKTKALDILGRSHDLRAGIYLTRALLHEAGFVGFHEGIQLLQRLIEERWEGVHPRLDPDDGDPIFRVNSLLPLADQDIGIRPLLLAPVVSSRALGSYSFRDYQVAEGVVQTSEDQESPDPAAINGAFMECEVEDLQATQAAIQGSIHAIESLQSKFTEQVGVENSIELSSLVSALKPLLSLLDEKLQERGVAVEGSGEPEASSEDEPAESGGVPAAQAPAPPRDEVNSRKDVIRFLDKICQYYERHEPSSPIPFLLQRARRLVDMNFIDIMKDIAPDGISQTELVTGVDTNEE